MRVVCPFCKTNFKAARSGAGKCPICGHRTIGTHRTCPNQWPLLALFALALSFLTYLAVTIVSNGGMTQRTAPDAFTVSITSVAITDNGYVIKGNVINMSPDVRLVPDLVFLFKSDTGAALAKVTLLPPEGIIEPMSEHGFTKRLAPRINGATKISVRFGD